MLQDKVLENGAVEGVDGLVREQLRERDLERRVLPVLLLRGGFPGRTLGEVLAEARLAQAHRERIHCLMLEDAHQVVVEMALGVRRVAVVR